MDIEKAIKAITEWYKGESFSIFGVTEEPIIEDANFEQSDDFISVVGFQHSMGDSGDSFQGNVYFEYEKGKYIATSFWM